MVIGSLFFKFSNPQLAMVPINLPQPMRVSVVFRLKKSKDLRRFIWFLCVANAPRIRRVGFESRARLKEVWHVGAGDQKT